METSSERQRGLKETKLGCWAVSEWKKGVYDRNSFYRRREDGKKVGLLLPQKNILEKSSKGQRNLEEKFERDQTPISGCGSIRQRNSFIIKNSLLCKSPNASIAKSTSMLDSCTLLDLILSVIGLSYVR